MRDATVELTHERSLTRVWQPEIDELNYRQQLAQQMGGEAGIARQRRRGKLTVRERIDALSDPGSFQETGGLAGSATYRTRMPWITFVIRQLYGVAGQCHDRRHQPH